MNLREEILAIKDIEQKTVKIKKWGNKQVIVKTMTAGDRYGLIEQATDKKSGDVDTTKLTMLMLIACTYDPATNERIFQSDDWKALRDKSSAAVEEISAVVREMNGLGGEQQEKAEKN